MARSLWEIAQEKAEKEKSVTPKIYTSSQDAISSLPAYNISNRTGSYTPPAPKPTSTQEPEQKSGLIPSLMDRFREEASKAQEEKRQSLIARTGTPSFRELDTESMSKYQGMRNKEELAETRKSLGEVMAQEGRIAQPESYSPENRVKYNELVERATALETSDKPYAYGVASGILPFSSTIQARNERGMAPENKELVEQAIDTGAYKAGQITGAIAQQATLYGAANAAVKALGVGSKLANTLNVGEKTGQFIGTQAADLLVDTMVQTPQEVYRAVKEDQTLGEATKDMALNRLLDVGINLAIGGIYSRKDIKSFLDNYNAKQIDEAVERTAKQSALVDAQKSASVTPTPNKYTAQQIQEETDRIVADMKKEIDNIMSVKGVENVADVSKSTVKKAKEAEDIIMTELPKGSLKDTAAKVKGSLSKAYREMVSTHAPLEKMDESTRIMSSNLNRVTGTVEHFIKEAQIDINGREIGQSLESIFDKIPRNKRGDFYSYILHQNNVDRYKQGKPIFDNNVTDTVSKARALEIEKANPEFKELQQQLVKYNQNLLDWGVDTGLMSKETADKLKSIYSNYVPAYRWKEFQDVYPNMPDGVKRVLHKAVGGAERPVLPMDTQMMMLTDKYVRNGRKNQLLNQVASVAEGGNEYAAKHIYEIKPTSGGKVDDIIEVGKDVAETTGRGERYTVKMYKNGKPYDMVVDKELHEALTAFNEDDFIYQVAKTINKYGTKPFKSLITEYNPIFGASNAMRDIPTALVFSKNPLKMVKNVPGAIADILKNGEDYKLYKAVGGSRGGFLGTNKGFSLGSSLDASSTKDTIKEVAGAIPKAVSDFNNFIETVPRLSEFKAALQATDDPFLAAYRAAELTVDFSRHGRTGKLADTIIPYLNPAIQGVDRFGRALANEPIKTAAKGALIITLPTAILDYANKDNEAYQNLTDRERNMYYNINVPGTDKFVRVPRSRELGAAFSSIYEWTARRARGEEVKPEEIAETIEENFKIQGLENAIWAPALKAWRQYRNPEAYETNYFGSLIVPQSLRKYSPGEQYNEHTTSVAKAIGQEFDVSPIVIDYLMDSYLGIIHDVNKSLTPDTARGLESLVTTKFVNDPVFRNKSMDEFYELMDSVSKQAQDYNRQENIPSEKETYLEDIANDMRADSRQISDLRKELRNIQASQKLEQEDKLKRMRELQDRINKIARSSVDKAEERVGVYEEYGPNEARRMLHVLRNK